MTRPVPAHGTYARARGVRPTATNPGRPSCVCMPCRDAARRYDKRMKLEHSRGQRRKVDAAPVIAHLRSLREAGAAWKRIADETGLALNQLKKLLGPCPPLEVRTTTAAAILAVTDVKPLTISTQAIPAFGAQRRLRALAAIGHSMPMIAAASGVWKTVLNDLVSGRSCLVERATLARICAAYSRLWNVPGQSQAHRNRAAREGWAGPLQWTDEALDDPAGFPDWTGHCGTPSGWLLHHAWGQEPCEACAGHAIDMGSRPHVREFVVTYQGAIEALDAADDWTWTRIGRLVHAKPDFVRDEYRKHTKNEMGVAA